MKLFKKIGLGLLSLAGIFSLAACNKTPVQEDTSTRRNMAALTVQTEDSTDGINQCWLDMLDENLGSKLKYLHTANFNFENLNLLLSNDLKAYSSSKTDKETYAVRAEGKFYTEDVAGINAFFMIEFYIHINNGIVDSYSLVLDYISDCPDILTTEYVNGKLVYDGGSTDNTENCSQYQCEDFTTFYRSYFPGGQFVQKVTIDQEEIYTEKNYDTNVDHLFLKILSCTCILSNSPQKPFIDTTAPSIVGENLYINVDNPLSFDQIKSRFTAKDETDGDITSKLSFTDNTYILTNGKINCGTYSFKVSVTDNAGNTTTKMYYAHVVDYTDPTITGKTINVSYTKQLTEAEKKALFTYSDNYTPTSNLIFRWVEDNYTSTYQNLGAHTLTAKVLDQQGNEASATATINVIDDVAPFMVVPENLKITTLDDLTLDSFRQYVTVTDEKEGNIIDFELTDLDDYLNHKKVAGTYRIKVVASDSAGNTIEKIFPFLNEDKDMPSIKIDPDYIMIVNQGDIITKEQVINYFVATGQLTLEESYGVEVASVYFEQPVAAAGFYSLRLMTEGKVIESKIEVVGDDISKVPPIEQEKPDFTEKYKENLALSIPLTILSFFLLVLLGVGLYKLIKKIRDK